MEINLKILLDYYSEITKDYNGILKLDKDFISSILEKQNFNGSFIKIKDIMFDFKNKTLIEELNSMNKDDLIKYIYFNEQDKKFALCATMRTHMLSCSPQQDKSRSIYNKDFLLSDMSEFLKLSIDVIENFNSNDELKLSVLKKNTIEDLLTKQNIDIISDYFSIVEKELDDTNKLLM